MQIHVLFKIHHDTSFSTPKEFPPKTRSFLLRTENENTDCDLLQYLVRYLYTKNIEIRPKNIIERNFPLQIKGIVPSILTKDGKYILGLINIIDYYNKILNRTDLMDKAKKFRKINPEYRIKDKSTHSIKQLE